MFNVGSIVQMHHILPQAIYDKYASDIARWTDGTFNLNAAC